MSDNRFLEHFDVLFKMTGSKNTAVFSRTLQWFLEDYNGSLKTAMVPKDCNGFKNTAMVPRRLHWFIEHCNGS